MALALNNLKRVDMPLNNQTKTLLGATIPGQRGPGSDDNKGVLHIRQSSSTTGTSPSNCFVSYPGKLGILTRLQRYSRRILQHKPTVL